MDTFCVEVGLAGRSKYLAQERLRFSDNLLIGPSANAITTHVRKRERYWKASVGAPGTVGKLYETLAEGCAAADRVDIVTGGRCSDLLFLGLMMQLGRAQQQEAYWHPSPPFEKHEEETIELAPHRDALRSLWLAFTGDSPKRFLERDVDQQEWRGRGWQRWMRVESTSSATPDDEQRSSRETVSVGGGDPHPPIRVRRRDANSSRDDAQRCKRCTDPNL